jgi:WD40 repeat protein
MERAHRGFVTSGRQLVFFSLAIIAFAACTGEGVLVDAQDNPATLVRADSSGVDLNGDALPAGALARLGTLRWRHAGTVTFVAFPTDHSILTGSSDNTLRLWDRATGKEIRRFTIPNVQPAAMRAGKGLPVARLGMRPGAGQLVAALSHDGNTLAVGLNNNQIQLWDVPTGKEIRQLKGPPAGTVTFAFSPDDRILALRSGDRTIHLLETGTGNEIRLVQAKQQQGPVRLVVVNGFIVGDAGPLAIARGGRVLASAETEFDKQDPKPFVKLTNLDTGEQITRIDAMPGASAIAFDAAGKVLAYANNNSIRLRDAADGKEIREINLPGGAVTVLFAPDGKTIAARARDGTVRLFQTETGNEVHTLGNAQPMPAGNAGFLRFANNETRNMAFSPDGKMIATGNGNSVRLWDAATGKELPLVEGHRGPVSTVSISADGKTLLSRGTDGFMRSWDLTAQRERCQFSVAPNASAVAFAPDGRTAVISMPDGNLRLLDAESGKPIRQARGHVNGTAGLAFSPDGKTLASLGSLDNTIRLTNAAKGSTLRDITLPAANQDQQANVFVVGGPLQPGAGTSLAFSADGKTLIAQIAGVNSPAMVVNGAVQGGRPNATMLRLYEVATGREIGKFPLPFQRGVGAISVLPDCRVVAVENSDGTVSLWEVASGKERAVIGKPLPPVPPPPAQQAFVVAARGGPAPLSASAHTLSFSPDGTLLAFRGPDRTICICDVGTGTEVGRFHGHDGVVAALAFAADGKTLASGSADTTILLWDVASLKRDMARPAAVAAEDAKAAWAELIGDDAAKAFQALRRLAGSPAQAMPLVREHIKPAVPADPKKLERLIADLDSEEFERRSTANTELERLGDLAVPALDKTVGGPINLEARRRIEAILAKQNTGTLTADQVRIVRAVELLERIGSPESRQVLQALAQGAPGALATRQAQGVLERTR